MSEIRGPYPDAYGFERWSDDGSSTYRRRFNDVLMACVSYLPGIGWGYVILADGVVINGRYETDWTADEAMTAALDAEEKSRIQPVDLTTEA